MKKALIFILIFAVIGLVAGYFIFGQNALGNYVGVDKLFKFSGGELGKFGRNLSGIAEIRKNILISGGVGAIVGLIISFIRKK